MGCHRKQLFLSSFSVSSCHTIISYLSSIHSRSTYCREFQVNVTRCFSLRLRFSIVRAMSRHGTLSVNNMKGLILRCFPQSFLHIDEYQLQPLSNDTINEYCDYSWNKKERIQIPRKESRIAALMHRMLKSARSERYIGYVKQDFIQMFCCIIILMVGN